jgi:hypothetical protein
MTTHVDARDAMLGLFNTGWQAAAAIVGAVPAIYWQDVTVIAPPVTNAYWCRVSTQGVGEYQTTHKTGIAPDNNRRYTSYGLLLVQIFCPTSVAGAGAKGRELAVLARNIFRGKATANDVWFRNARINEIPPEPNFYRFNVICEYQYDDIG